MNASSLAEEISSPSSSQPHSDQEIHSNFSQIVETAEFVLSVVPSPEGSYITNNQIKQHPSSEVPCDSLALSLPEVPRNSLAPLSQDSSYHPPTPQVQHFYSWPKDYSTPPPPPPLAPSFPEVRRNSLAPSSPQDSSDHPPTLQDQQDSSLPKDYSTPPPPPRVSGHSKDLSDLPPPPQYASNPSLPLQVQKKPLDLSLSEDSSALPPLPPVPSHSENSLASSLH